jgi:hypothetical protein
MQGGDTTQPRNGTEGLRFPAAVSFPTVLRNHRLEVPVNIETPRPLVAFFRPRYCSQREELVMDSAQHCINQSTECRRLMELAQSEAEAYALKNLSRTWSGLAGQIDRYNALMREQRNVVRKFSQEGSPE